MDQRTLRTIGAAVVLVGVGFAGIAQIDASRNNDRAEVNVENPSKAANDSIPATDVPTTVPPEPFTFRVGVLAGVSTDNFWAFYGEQPSVWNSYILGPTKAALFTSDPAHSTLEPELAVSTTNPIRTLSGWEVTVDLDPNHAWSDGTPITAHDLVFTFETVRSAGLGGSWVESFPDSVASITADGDHRVHIEFGERPNLAVWPHGVGLAPIMANHIWAEDVAGLSAEDIYALSGARDVSGGPLTVSSVSSDLIISVANSGLSTIPDTVEYHVFSDENGAVAALGSAEIDFILSPKGLTEESLGALESDPGVETIRNPGNGVRYLGFNLEREPMAEHAFRTALALLLDRDGLAQSIPQTGSAAWAIVPEANAGWFDPEAAEENAALYRGPLGDRLQAALEGLEAAGYTWDTAPSAEDGVLVAGTGLRIGEQTPQPLTILTPGDAYDPARSDYAAEIAATLGILGFDARPVETDFDTVVDLAFTPGEEGELHYDMYLLGWTLGNPALPGYYGTLFSEGAELNNTGYSSDEFADALQSYERAYTHHQALDAVWEMERILAADLPYLVLYGSETTEAYRSDRVVFEGTRGLGGIQARLGGILDVKPAGSVDRH